MKGGKYLASGADTCVYDPPVACTDDTKVDVDLKDKVSRVVRRSSGEAEIQDKLREHLKKLGDDVARNFNLSVARCTPAFTDADERGKCTASNYSPSTDAAKLDNLITPKQGADIHKLAKKPDAGASPEAIDKYNRWRKTLRKGLEDLLIAVSELNADGFVHNDTHFGNIAFMGYAGTGLVLHDWGRAIDGVENINAKITKIKAIPTNDKNKIDTKTYPQHFYLYNFIDNMTTVFPELKGACDWRSQAVMRVYCQCLWDTFGILPCASRRGLITPHKEIPRFFEKLAVFLKETTATARRTKKAPTPAEVKIGVQACIRELFKAPTQTAAIPPPAATAPVGGGEDDDDPQRKLTPDEQKELLADMNPLIVAEKEIVAADDGSCPTGGRNRKTRRRGGKTRTRAKTAKRRSRSF